MVFIPQTADLWTFRALVHAGALRRLHFTRRTRLERARRWLDTILSYYVGLIGVTSSHERTGPNTLHEGEIPPASVRPR